jgi:electron-transferring-flavoprotein dehydrogenase
MAEQRDVIDVDILIVGAGPAGLAAAYHLTTLIKDHNARAAAGDSKAHHLEVNIAILEKGSEVGAHQLSGAVLDPSTLKQLMPNFLQDGCPVESKVTSDEVVWLKEKGQTKVPIVPPPLKQHGNYVISLSKLVRWMAPIVEKRGVTILTGMAGDDIIVEKGKEWEVGQRVAGIRMIDRGVTKKGTRKNTFALGEEVRAKATLFCDGTYGNLSLKLIDQFKLNKDKNPQTFATGVKEVWEISPDKHKPGKVTHTMGWPLKNDAFGGGWIYHMNNNQVSLGLVIGLDYRDPFLDMHAEFQRFKTHPMVADLLAGGKLVSYGAKTIPEGGWFAMPKLAVNSALLLGDAAGMVNVPKLKGIHYAIESGMIAAEVTFEGLKKGDFSMKIFEKYQDRVEKSIIGQDLFKYRYFKEYFHKGFTGGVIKSGISFFTGGKFPGGTGQQGADYQTMEKVKSYYYDQGGERALPKKPDFDKKLTFSKLDDIYVSGTNHEEDQPSHLVVKDLELCMTQCAKEYQNPCQHFCPANVYNVIKDEATGKKSLLVNAPNCVHCKTCDIKDPYRNILWKVPEGGGGPNYRVL